MTPELLKQARDSAQALIDRWDSPHWKEAEHTGVFIARLREVVSALDAHAALSDYDKAIHAIAPYLPDWVRFVVCEDNNRLRMFGEHADPFFIGPQWGFTSGMPDPNYPGEYTTIKEFTFLRVPNCCGGSEKSLRRITHNSDGTVTVERG